MAVLIKYLSNFNQKNCDCHSFVLKTEAWYSEAGAQKQSEHWDLWKHSVILCAFL